MLPISPAVCDHMTVMDVGVTCATMGEGVDGTGGGGGRERVMVKYHNYNMMTHSEHQHSEMACKCPPL